MTPLLQREVLLALAQAGPLGFTQLRQGLAHADSTSLHHALGSLEAQGHVVVETLHVDTLCAGAERELALPVYHLSDTAPVRRRRRALVRG